MRSCPQQRKPPPERRAAEPRCATSNLDGRSAEGLQPAAETLLQVDLRRPAEDLPRAGVVWPPPLRIVGRQGLEDDLARRAGDADHGLRELEHRRLVIGVADV